MKESAENSRQTQKKQTKQTQCQTNRINVLPDEVLLKIFDFYLNTYRQLSRKDVEAWQLLVRVCRRWRNIVLGSPRRLNLRLYCTQNTRARHTLDIWPDLPLIVDGDCMTSSSGMDNIVATLEQSNRVCQVLLEVEGWQLEKVLPTMQVPFPELTDLQILSYDETPPLIPDSFKFLDGSAPRLRSFCLWDIPFPGLSKLLLSAPRLVDLSLKNSSYIPPEAIAAVLSVLSSLERLVLEFQTPQCRPKSRPDWESRILPSPRRSTLPALYLFDFKGVTEYLEGLLTFIDAPQLRILNIAFFGQIDFDCPRLAQFINCAPKLRACSEAHVEFKDSTASVKLRYQTSNLKFPFGVYESRFDDLQIDISCREPDRQLLSIKRVCNSYFLSMVEDLYIGPRQLRIVDTIGNTLWLQFLLPFTAVKNLYMFKEFGPGIVDALQDLVGGRITEVLPSLQNMSVEWIKPLQPFRENIERFVTARRLSGKPVAVDVRNERFWK